jgi:hypothetical protein
LYDFILENIIMRIFVMSTTTMTKQQSVINYLSSGRSLNQDRAMQLFGVRNLRATISDVKEQVEAYGNWRIVRKEGRDGTSRYSMERVVKNNTRRKSNTRSSR